jgi:hypothetical protein
MQIPAAYAATLAAVRGVFPGALIAGGALRDLDNGRPVKDIDVTIPSWGGDFASFRKAAAPLIPAGTITKHCNASYGWQDECLGYIDIPSVDGLPVQLIALTTGPESLLHRLDFGICRIGYDGVEVIKTDEYLADQATQSFTLLRADDSAQRDRSIRRFERLSEKYPGWKLVDPDAEPFVLN